MVDFLLKTSLFDLTPRASELFLHGLVLLLSCGIRTLFLLPNFLGDTQCFLLLLLLMDLLLQVQLLLFLFDPAGLIDTSGSRIYLRESLPILLGSILDHVDQ